MRQSLTPKSWAAVPEQFWRLMQSLIWHLGGFTGSQRLRTCQRMGIHYEAYMYASRRAWYWRERRKGEL